MASKTIVALGLAVAPLVTACISTAPRGAEVCSQDQSCGELSTEEAKRVSLERHQRYSLGFIEFGGLGKAKNPEQIERVIEEIGSISGKDKALVVLFVHGWRHTARPNDDHVKFFRESLEKLAVMDELEGRRPIGVYLGWPGTWLPKPLDFVTYLDRSITAGLVAEGCGVREALRRMSKAVADRQEAGADVVSVAIGHSLGGKLLFVPVEERLEEDLVDCETRELMACPKDLGDLFLFGDMTILLNPAQDIRDFDKVVCAAEQLPGSSDRLSIFSSKGDSTIKVAYRLGRSLRNLWPPYWRYYVSESIGVGWRSRQVTHDLSLPDTPTTPAGSDTQQASVPQLSPRKAEGEEEVDCEQLRQRMSESEDEPSCLQLRRRESENEEEVQFPVIRVDSRIIKKHGDIFGEVFRKYLRKYVAERVRSTEATQ